MRPRKAMESEDKAASMDHVEIPVVYLQHPPQIRRTVITIPGKCIGRTKVTHEILFRFNWSRMSLFLTVVAITMASVVLVVLLLA